MVDVKNALGHITRLLFDYAFKKYDESVDGII